MQGVINVSPTVLGRDGSYYSLLVRLCMIKCVLQYLLIL